MEAAFSTLSLRNISLKREYRSGRDDLVSEFFVPCLKNATHCDSSIEFVKVKTITTLANGFQDFVERGGILRMITGSKFKPEDLTVLQKAFNALEKRGDLRNYPASGNEPIQIIERMIQNQQIRMKIAIPDFEGASGQFLAENMGIFRDSENNSVAFRISSNETISSDNKKFESVDVFTSWEDSARVNDKVANFENLWENKTNLVRVVDFKYADKNNLLKYDIQTYAERAWR